MASDNEVRPGYVLVYAKSIRLRNGKVIYAHNYGHEAFRFWAKIKK